mmetsp:Transcript_1852/g.3807  ORF Transcript_1852/g.3807 Transcript_1852/m.3807 type:complete len:325 (+) Transcript_1852:207-1181(+)
MRYVFHGRKTMRLLLLVWLLWLLVLWLSFRKFVAIVSLHRPGQCGDHSHDAVGKTDHRRRRLRRRRRGGCCGGGHCRRRSFRRTRVERIVKRNNVRLILPPALVKEGIVDGRLARVQMDPSSLLFILLTILILILALLAQPNLGPNVIRPIHHPSYATVPQRPQHPIEQHGVLAASSLSGGRHPQRPVVAGEAGEGAAGSAAVEFGAGGVAEAFEGGGVDVAEEGEVVVVVFVVVGVGCIVLWIITTAILHILYKFRIIVIILIVHYFTMRSCSSAIIIFQRGGRWIILARRTARTASIVKVWEFRSKPIEEGLECLELFLLRF